VVLLAPAPPAFTDAQKIGVVTPLFERRADDGEHWIVSDAEDRLPVVLIEGATAATPAAAVIPLDQNFAARAEAALRLWRVVTGQPRGRPPDRLTRLQRKRLILALRALDGRLAGESYRTIAQVLFGERRVPSGSAWKTHDLRDRTIRLVRTGLELMRGGYLNLLRYPRRRRR
jgi:hypothetical protein